MPRTKSSKFNNSNTLLKKGLTYTDHRISVCTDCNCGIFDTQEKKWTSRGLVHTKCFNKELNEVETST